jgi:hypothetical protein
MVSRLLRKRLIAEVIHCIGFVLLLHACHVANHILNWKFNLCFRSVAFVLVMSMEAL